MVRPIYERGAPLPTRERVTFLERQQIATRIGLAEAAIGRVPAYKRSWCRDTELDLRARLSALAATLSDGEICEYVTDALESAWARNRRRPRT